MAALGRSRPDRLQRVNQYMVDWYADHPGTNRLPELKATNVRMADGWADLHGITIKVANTRAAAPLFRDMCVAFFTCG
eukprot:4340050-Pyramimonas_sp.AAC.1